ncbi:MAG: hypothetical protein ACPG1A_06005 [Halioglobus sp.]
MKNNRQTTVARPVLLLSLLSLFGLSGCEEPVVVEEATRVVITPVAQQDVTLFGNYVGHTRASQRVEVNPRVDGFLEEISFVEGSVVDAGTTLYKID